MNILVLLAAVTAVRGASLGYETSAPYHLDIPSIHLSSGHHDTSSSHNLQYQITPSQHLQYQPTGASSQHLQNFQSSSNFIDQPSYTQHTVKYAPWPYQEPLEPPEKHIYLFVGPSEPEEPRVTTILEPPPKKRVKIIFIKVPPSQPFVQKELILPQKVNEKTLVYVLVKKPEDPPPIIIPRTTPSPPAKPEVFVIKYKSEKDLGNAEGISDSIVYGETHKTEDEVNSELLNVGGINGEQKIDLHNQRTVSH